MLSRGRRREVESKPIGASDLIRAAVLRAADVLPEMRRVERFRA
jgi:hypothetical protein